MDLQERNKRITRDRKIVIVIGIILLALGLICKVFLSSHSGLGVVGDIYTSLGLSTIILFSNRLFNLTQKHNKFIKGISISAIVAVSLCLMYLDFFQQQIYVNAWVQIIGSLVLSTAIGFMFASFDESLTRAGE